MSTRTRVLLTIALGVVLGLDTWLGTRGFSPSQGVEGAVRSMPLNIAFWTFLIGVPLIVDRWWVVASLAGRFVALLILQLTGHTFEEYEETGSPISSLSILGLVYFAFLMWILVGIRRAFDFLRRRRTAASS